MPASPPPNSVASRPNLCLPPSYLGPARADELVVDREPNSSRRRSCSHHQWCARHISNRWWPELTSSMEARVVGLTDELSASTDLAARWSDPIDCCWSSCLAISGNRGPLAHRRQALLPRATR
ncbi:hypothetical protein DAI22_05g020332 [Oryza sativa Japonica Group]|nr:hypothetical protein DAI22_05g020332 [Oryza sativa Japonica Group]